MIKDHKGRLPYVGEPDYDGAHCFVKHEHAGGPCRDPATFTVYGLNYCAAHGEECKLAALAEACHDADQLFERFSSGEVRPMSEVIERVISRISYELMGWDDGTVQGRDYYEVLVRAYPDAPPKVRGLVQRWERDEGTRGPTPADALLDSLEVVHKTMRVAYEGEQTMLVELLEQERQSYAAQCAYAVRDYPRQVEAALARTRERPGDAA